MCGVLSRCIEIRPGASKKSNKRFRDKRSQAGKLFKFTNGEHTYHIVWRSKQTVAQQTIATHDSGKRYGTHRNIMRCRLGCQTYPDTRLSAKRIGILTNSTHIKYVAVAIYIHN